MLSRKLVRQTCSSSRLEQNEAVHEVKRVSKSGNLSYMPYIHGALHLYSLITTK